MDCPNCSFEIPSECCDGLDYRCPNCGEAYRGKVAPDGCVRMRRMGPSDRIPTPPREGGFREHFQWLVGAPK